MFCKQNFIERPDKLNVKKERQFILQRKGAGLELTLSERFVLESVEEGHPDYGQYGLASGIPGSPLSNAWHDFMRERTEVFHQCKNMEPGFQAIVDMDKIFNDLIDEEDVLLVFSKVASIAKLSEVSVPWVQYVTPEGLVLSKEDFINRYSKD